VILWSLDASMREVWINGNDDRTRMKVSSEVGEISQRHAEKVADVKTHNRSPSWEQISKMPGAEIERRLWHAAADNVDS